MVVCGACGEENPERAKFCLNCAAALKSTAPTRDVRKTVTVLFADVSGSTSLGEQLDPEALRTLMSRYFAGIKQVVERHGGTVEKFIGDAVMAVFGIPVLHEDDALRAVRAAAQIRDTVATLNAELETGKGVALAFRTGLNTGEVVAGDPAASQTLVTGDPVNTAARLEQAAAPGDILLGEATYRLVREAEQVARRGLAIASLDDISAVVPLRLAIASVEARRGNAGQAADVAEELIGLLAASDCHPIVGDLLSRAAQIHLAAGNRERATALFGDALQKYRQKGARGLAAMLEQRMASLGVRLSGDA